MTQIALGTIPFGSILDDAASFAILDEFYEAGGRILDTANNYPYWLEPFTGDESELAVGRWLASRGVRDEMIISTKAGGRPDPSGEREGLSAKSIAAAVEGSLRRLGVDRIDVYWAHVDDRSVPVEETAAAFADVVARGLAGRIGVSNTPAWRLERARKAAADGGWTPFTEVQLRHSYVRPRPGTTFVAGGHQQLTDEMIDYARSEGVTIWAYHTLMNGGYTRADRPLEEAYDHPGTARRLAALDEVARELGVTRNQVVLAWLTGGDPPITPIVGVSSQAQLKDALGASEVKLDADLREKLDQPR